MNFDWQTEDDPEQLEETGNVTETSSRGRSWPWIVAFLLLVAAGGFLLWREANEQVAEAQAVAEENVRSSHRLLQRAIAAGDKELFLTLLSSRDGAWLEAQLQRLEEGKLAAPLGLTPAGGSEVLSVELNPEFTEAVLVAHQVYSFAGQAGVTKTVTLEHNYVYRRGEQRWLFSPPQEAFWGAEQHWEGELVAVRYQERDGAVAPRLGSELDKLLGDFCGLEGVLCPRGLHLEVTLSTDIQSLAALDRVQAVLEAAEDPAQAVFLPSPTLVGLPPEGPNDAAYEVLMRAYARPVVAAALARSIGFECCRGVPFFSALVQKQLSRLEVEPWPMGPEAYTALLVQGVDSLTVNGPLDDRELDRNDQRRWREALALVAFLEAELGPEQFLAAGRGAYGLWLERHNEDPDRFVSAWLRFIHSRSISGEVAGSPTPDGALQFSCRLNNGGVTLVGYDFTSRHWSELLHAGPPEPVGDGSAGFVDIVTLPGDYGYVVQEFTYGGMLVAESGRLIWHPKTLGGADAQAILIQEWVSGRDSSIRPRMIGYHPNGRYLVLADFVLPFRSDIPFTGPSWLVDLERCESDGCGFGSSSSPAQPLAGTPLWSPNGQQALLQGQVRVDPESGQTEYELHHAGQEGQNGRVVGVGMAPFWLNDSYYGYLRAREGGAQGSGAQELVIASVEDDRPRVVATLADFREALGESGQPLEAFYGNILALRSDRAQLLVQAQSRGPGETATTYVFLVEMPDPQGPPLIELLLTSEQQVMVVPSPDGRRLAVREFDATGWDNSAFYLLDIETGERQSLGTGGESLWSSDGRWLVRSFASYFLVWNVETGASLLIDNGVLGQGPRPGCTPDAWVNG